MAAARPQSTTDGLSLDAEFATTHWSTVLAAGDSQSERAADALAKLCRTYWYPLYFYVRRLGHGPEDAQDLTQEFFARVLEKRYLKTVDPEKGKFRSFLPSFSRASWPTVAHPKDIDEEIRHLFAALSG